MRSIRAVIADDHMMVREGLTVVLNRIPGLSVVAQARSWTEAIPAIDRYAPDIALLDVRMPGMEAAQGVTILRHKHPALRIVLISAFDCDEDIYGVIRAGANGFVVKNCSPQEIPTCIRAVLRGKRWLPSGPAAKLAQRLQTPALTARQVEILQIVTEGKTNKEVAAVLKITEGTVKVQMNHIFHKLSVTNRTEAVTQAMQRGLVRLNRKYA
ncbi:MAG: response regulator [Candidatus Acidiferrales bacterium]